LLAGTVAFSDNETGDINFTADGVVQLAAGKTITGHVDNITGTDGAGTLTFAGASTVTKSIGATNALKLITAAQSGTAAVFGSSVAAATINLGSGTVSFGGDITGAVNVNNAGSVITIADGAKVTGNINNTTGSTNGTITFSGSTTINGIVGNGSAFSAVSVGATGSTSVFNDALNATKVSVGAGAATFNGAVNSTFDLNGGDITLADGVNLTGGVNSTYGSDNHGALTLKGSSNIGGDVGSTNTLSSVSIINTSDSTINFDGAVSNKTLTLGANAGTATFAGAAKINDAVTFTHADQTLIFNTTSTLSNGADFAGFDSKIVVDSKGGSNTFTGALKTTSDGTGTLAIQGGNSVTIASNVGDNTNSIFAVTIADSTNTNFGGNVYAKTLNTGSGSTAFNGNVTGAINIASDGGAITLAAGKIITGAVDNTTSHANQGTLALLGNSTVTDVIGATNALSSVSAGAIGATSIFGAAINAETVAISSGAATFNGTVTGLVTLDGGAITVGGGANINGAIENVTGEDDAGSVTFSGSSDITGIVGKTNSLHSVSVGATGSSSEFHSVVNATTVNVGSGAVIFDGNVTGNIKINSNGGSVTLADGVDVSGIINNITGNANQGTLVLEGSSVINDVVGGSNSLASISAAVANSTSEFKQNVTTQSLVLGGANGKVIFDGVTKVTDVVNFNAGAQQLTFNADATLTNGANFNGNNSTLLLDSTAGDIKFTGVVSTTTNETGSLKIQGANTTTVASQVGAADHSLLYLTTEGASNAVFNSDVYARNIGIGSGDVSFKGDVTTTGMVITNGAITIASDHTIDGRIDSAEGATSTINATGNLNITGLIGDDNAVSVLNVNANGATINLGSDANILNFNFNGNAVSTLVFDGTSNFTGNINAGGENSGIVDATNNNVTITGNVGGVDALNQVKIGSDNTLTVAGGNLNTKSIYWGNNNSTLVLDSNAASSFTVADAINPANANSNGVFLVKGSGDRSINATFGSAGNLFNSFELGGTGMNTFAAGNGAQYFTAVTFVGAEASKGNFAGGATINDQVVFTAAGQELTFAGNSTLTGGLDFNGQDNNLKLDSSAGDMTLSGGAITDSTGGNTGTIAIVSTANTVTINNNIGTDVDHRIGAMTMADGSTSIMNGEVYATNVSLSGNADATFNGNVKITAGLSVTDGVLDFGADTKVYLNNINLAILGSGTINFYGYVDITGAELIMGAGKMNFYGETKGGVVKLNEGNPSVTYDETAFASLWNDVVNDTVEEVFGTMNVTKADLDFNGKIGLDTDNAIADLNIGDAETATNLHVHHDVYAADVNFLNSDATLSFAKANLSVNGNIIAGTDGYGIVDANDNSATITGSVGSEVLAIQKIEIGADKTITANSDVYADQIIFGGANATLVSAGDISIHADAVTLGANTGDIVTNSNLNFDGNIGTSDDALNQIKIADSSTFTANQDVYTTSVYFGDVNSTLVLAGADNTTSIVDVIDPANANSQGILQFTASGTNTVKATFGTAANSFAQFDTLSASGTVVFDAKSGTQYFTAVNLSANTGTAVVFDGGASINDQLIFTDNAQVVEFGANTTLTNGADFNGTNGTITLDASLGNATLDGAVTTSANTTSGILNVNSSAANTFTINGALGNSDTQRLSSVNVNDAASAVFASDVYAQDVNFNGTGSATFDGKLNADDVSVGAAFAYVTFNDNVTATITTHGPAIKLASGKEIDGTIDGNADNTGSLVLLGDGSLLGAVGNIHSLSSITTAANSTATFSGAVNTKTLTFKGDVVFNDQANITDTVNFTADAQSMTVKANATFDSNFAGKNSTIIFDSTNADVEFNGNITTTKNNTGTIKLQGANQVTVIGEIGDATYALSTIELAADLGNASFSGGDVYAKNITIKGGSADFSNNVTANIGLNGVGVGVTLGDSVKVTGAIDNTSVFDGSGQVTISGNSEITGSIGDTQALASLVLNGGVDTTVTLGSVVNAKAIAIGAGQATFNDDVNGAISLLGTVNLADAKTITGNIDGNTKNTGVLNFLGDSTVDGQIGNTHPVNTINAAAANSTSTFNDVVKAQDITLSVGAAIFKGNVTGDITTDAGTITLADTVNVTGDIKNVGAENAAILIFEGTSIISGVIGGDNAFGSITAASDVVFDGQVKTKTFNFSGNAHFNAGAEINDEVIFNANQSLTFGATSTLVGGVNFGGNDGFINLDSTAGDATLTGEIISSGVGKLSIIGSKTFTVESAVGTLGEIYVGTDSNAVFDSTTSATKITLDAGSKTTFRGNVTGDINGVGDGDDASFVLDYNGVVDGEVGKDVRIGKIYAALEGQVSIFHNSVNTKALIMGGSNGIIRFDDLVDVNDEVLFTANGQRLMFNADTNLTNGIDYNGNYANIVLDSTDGNATFTGVVKSSGAGDLQIQGVNTFTVASAVGSEENVVGHIKIDNASNAIFSSDVYASTIDNISNVTFASDVHASAINVGTGSVTTFSGDIYAPINGSDSNKGSLVFADNNTVNGAIGSDYAVASMSVAAANTTSTFNDSVSTKALVLVGEAGVVTFNDGVNVTDQVFFTNDDQDLTFNKNSHLTGGVNFAGNNGTITLDSSVAGNTFTGAITTAANSTSGTLAITGGANTVTVMNQVGNSDTQRLSSVTVADATNAIFIENVYTETMSIDGGSVQLLTAADYLADVVNFTKADSSIYFTNGAEINTTIDNTTGDDNNGTLIIGAGDSTFGGAIGATHSLKAINLQGSDAVIFGAAVKATTMSIDANSVSFNSDATADITVSSTTEITLAAGKNITGSIDVSAADLDVTLNMLGGDSTITGKIGDTKAVITINAAATGATSTFGSSVNAANIRLGSGDAIFNGNVIGAVSTISGNITIAAGKNVTGAIINSGTTNIGSLTLEGASTISGVVGGDNAFAKVTTANGSTATFEGLVNTKALDFNGNVNFAGGAEINDAVIFNGEQLLTFGATSTVDGGINFDGNDGTITLDSTAGDATLTGAITSSGVGSIAIEGGNTFTLASAVGANGANVAIIAIEDDSKAAFASDVYADIMLLGSGSVATFNGDVSAKINGQTTNDGSLIFTGNNTITGTVGKTAALSSISVAAANSTTTFTDSVNTKTLIMQGASGVAVFNDEVSVNDQILFTAASQQATFKANTNLAGGISFAGFNDTIILDSTKGDISFAGAINTAESSTSGTLAITGGNVVTITDQIGDSSSQRLSVVNVQDGEATFDASVYAKNITLSDGAIANFAQNIDVTSGGLALLGSSIANITGNSTITGSITGTGSIKASNNLTVTGSIAESGNVLNTITVGGNSASALTVGENVYAKSFVFGNDASSLIMNGNSATLSITGGINGNNANKNTITINGTNTVVSTTIGNSKALSAINVNSAGNNFKNAVTVQSLNINNASSTATFAAAATIANTVSFTAANQQLTFNDNITSAGFDLAGFDSDLTINKAGQSVKVMNSGAAGHGIFTLGANHSLGYDVASNGHNIAKVVVVGGNTLNTNGHTIYADQISNSGGGGTLTLNTNYAGTIGESGALFNTVNVSGNIQLANIYANTTAVTSGSLSVSGKIDSSVVLSGSSSLTIQDGATLAGAVDGASIGSGTVSFLGNATISDNIGSTTAINTVSLAANKTYTLQAARINAAVNAGSGATITIDHDTVAMHSITGSNLTMNLGNNTLALDSGGVMTGNGVLNLTIRPGDNGAVQVNGGTLDISGLASLNLNVSQTEVASTAVAYQVFVSNNATIHPYLGPVLVNHSNSIIKWEYDAQSMSLLSGINSPVVEKLLTMSGNDNALFNADNTGGALQLSFMVSKIQDPVIQQQVMASLKPSVQVSADATSNVTASVSGALSARMDNISMDSFSVDTTGTVTPVGGNVDIGTGSNSDTVGGERNGQLAASGDDSRHIPMGAWASGFGGVANQSKLSNLPGSKAKVVGSSLGFDAKFSDKLIGGVAATYADVKMNTTSDFTSNSKAPSWRLSLYGIYNLDANWFTRGILSYGQSDITTTASRPTAVDANNLPIGYVGATGKYKSQSMASEFTVGYRHVMMQKWLLSPTAGITYDGSKDAGYSETGGGITNRIVNSKTYHKVSGTLGLSVATITKINGLLVTPEVHASMSQILSARNPITMSKIMDGGAEVSPQEYKLPKSSYNIGCGVNVNHGAMNFGIGYDLRMSKKYISNQGYVKMKVNF
jgi:hypothetical protein